MVKTKHIVAVLLQAVPLLVALLGWGWCIALSLPCTKIAVSEHISQDRLTIVRVETELRNSPRAMLEMEALVIRVNHVGLSPNGVAQRSIEAVSRATGLAVALEAIL